MSDQTGSPESPAPRTCASCGTALPGNRLVCPACKTLWRDPAATGGADTTPVGSSAPTASGYHPPQFTGGIPDQPAAVAEEALVRPPQPPTPPSTGALRALPILAAVVVIGLVAAVAFVAFTDDDPVEGPNRGGGAATTVPVDARRTRTITDDRTGISWRMAATPTELRWRVKPSGRSSVPARSWDLRHDGWTERVTLVTAVPDADITQMAFGGAPSGSTRLTLVEAQPLGPRPAYRLTGRTASGRPIDFLVHQIGATIVFTGAIGDTRLESTPDPTLDLARSVRTR